MNELSSQSAVAEPASHQADSALAAAQVLDRPHLTRQTLGDAKLERIVLDLFLQEAPRYAADIQSAHDIKSWRMAVHTLKGVSLNIGAFRLAQLCRQDEGFVFGAEGAPPGAAHALSAMIDVTVLEIRQVMASAPAH